MNSGIILMAGSGERSHLDYNKVLYNYLGKPLFIHSLDAFYHHPKIDEVFLVINKQDEENIKKYHKMPMDQLIDLSINEMFRRTMMTSVSTLLAMVGLYLFSGEVLREFAIAMTFSIIMGTLTSIYISNVVLMNFNLRDEK